MFEQQLNITLSVQIFAVLAIAGIAVAQQPQNNYAFTYSVNQQRSDAGIPSQYESTVNDQYSFEQSQQHLHNQQQRLQQDQQQLQQDQLQQQQDQALRSAQQYQEQAAYQQQQW